MLFYSGAPVQRPGGLDQNYAYQAHPSYYWISGNQRANSYVLYSPRLGWVDFHDPISLTEIIWEGAEPTTTQSPSKSSANDTHPQNLSAFLEKHQIDAVIDLAAPSNLMEASVNEYEKFFALRLALHQQRRIKDAEEVALIERLANIASFGYKKIQSILRPGITEKEIQIEYEAEIARHDSEGVPYESIVGSGRRSAILHALPTAKVIGDEELILVDAGAEISQYCVDITRVFTISGHKTKQQQDLFDIVLAAQTKSIEKCRAGTEWYEVHNTSAQVIAEGLKSLGVLTGSNEELLSTGAVGLFFPHGVGHLVGLRVRDTGCEEVTHPKTYSGARLRVDFKIQPNYLLTVEPGCYFIEALLNQPENREKFKNQVNWQQTEKWLPVGGIRLEDDILITEGTPKNLTAFIPK